MAIIEARNLTFSYDAQSDGGANAPLKTALSGVDISINKGELVAVLGHNGSGKSTFAKHINAIYAPTVGTVTVDGMDTSDDKNLIPIRRKAGMVFQNPDNQLVASLVEDDVAFAPENLGVAPDEIRKRVDDALETVGMSEYKKHEVHRLSGGQKQRVAIAGVLAMQPEILILDEPTAMLDPKGRKEVIDTVIALNREKNMTVVLITHFMDEAALCGRIIVMNDGKVELDGTPKEVFSHVGHLRKIGLEVPQVTQMAHDLRQKGIDIPNDIITVDEFFVAFLKLAGGTANE